MRLIRLRKRELSKYENKIGKTEIRIRKYDPWN
jgi:hypothetical protein